MSLEGVIVPLPQLLTREDHDAAMRLFDTLVKHFEHSDPIGKGLKPVTLVRLVKNEVSDKDSFLRFFFCFIEEHLDGISKSNDFNLAQSLSRLGSFTTWTTEGTDVLRDGLVKFAKTLMDNFFLPLKALASKTPYNTPGPLSRLQLSEGGGIGTPQRLKSLRDDCLERDRHRCVVTRKFSVNEAQERFEKDGDNLKDDDGESLLPERNEMAYLEVAHIFPHSLMSLSSNSGEQKLSESKEMAHKILNMFNPTIIPLISGTDIDRPMNALTLTKDAHTLFGNFEIAFEHISDHQYKIDYANPNQFVRIIQLPVTRTLYLTPDQKIDHPSVDFLKVHHAIARILYLSGAGEYIDKFIRDMDEMEGGQVNSNGSSRIDEY
ncbi:hypothetical protein ETB97_002859 [Aspergillus alliaceus]|uniref:HNH nuclease domain-containing protein n=1 Tax=Petromyces alliaceus TaxID=209559 RepID=A0A8H6E4S7_PETAA|nr:hypothetical protein ETB97_002859 [Aspergillus burnettii]